MYHSYSVFVWFKIEKMDGLNQLYFEIDTDGVLSFPELEVVMKNLGQVPTETELLRMVREVGIQFQRKSPNDPHFSGE